MKKKDDVKKNKDIKNEEAANNKKFTFVDVLIVVAIIAGLIFISIPIFTKQIEKSKEAVDLDNIRAAYAEVMSAALNDTAETHDEKFTNVKREGESGSFVWSVKVTLTQSVNGWQGPALDIGRLYISLGQPTAGGYCIVKYTEGDLNAKADFY